MNRQCKLKDESGTALVIALIMIIVLTLIGLASTFTSTFEVKLSGNKRVSTEAFYDAERRTNAFVRNLKTIQDKMDKKQYPFEYQQIDNLTNANLTADEINHGLNNEGECGSNLTHKVVNVKPSDMPELASLSGLDINDSGRLSWYLGRVGGQGASTDNKNYFVFVTGVDQTIADEQLKSRCEVMFIQQMYNPAPEDSM